ncbi:MAG TPA: TetR/AcrR family transcriptional regulator [Kofleriaceae bacterium]|nr:TetR/AcrR family transcriptional regulator [Kofleriaceae bacterium]
MGARASRPATSTPAAPPPAPAAPAFVDAPARTFTQARAQRTYEALLAGAEQAFGERGYEATGTPEIAAAAGVAVGTFYRYFDDKLACYLELSRRHLAAGYHRIMDRLTPERFAGKDRDATVAEAIRVLVDHVSASPQHHRAFLEASLRVPEVQALRRAFDDATWVRLAALIAAVCPRSDVPDPDATAWVIMHACVEAATAMAGIHGAAPLPPARAKAALAALILRALFPHG